MQRNPTNYFVSNWIIMKITPVKDFKIRLNRIKLTFPSEKTQK